MTPASPTAEEGPARLIKRLEEALDAIQTGSIGLLERKAGDARTLVELLQKLGSPVAVQSNTNTEVAS